MMPRIVLLCLGVLWGCTPLPAVETADPPRDLSLQQAFELAIRHNPSIRGQLATVEQTAGIRSASRSIALPTLEISPASGGFQGPRGERDPRLFGLLQTRFSQPIFDMAIPPTWRLGDLQVAIAIHNYWATVNSIFYSIRNAYITAYFAPSLSELATRGSEVFEGVGRDLEQAAQTGVANTTEVDRSRYEAARIRTQVPALAVTRREALNQLAQLMGFDLAAESSWIDEVRLVSSPRTSAAAVPYRELVESAKRNRPDLALLRAAAEAEGEVARIAFAAQLPIITLEARLQSIPQETSEDTLALDLSATGAEGVAAVPTAATTQNTQIQNEVRIGPAVEWAIFDGFEALGRTRAARSRQLAQQVNAEGLARQIAIGVSLRKKRIAALQARLAQIRGSLPTAEQTSEAALQFMREDTTPTSFAQFEFSTDEKQSLDLQQTALLTEQALALEYSFLDFITGRYIQLTGLEPPVERRLPPGE